MSRRELLQWVGTAGVASVVPRRSETLHAQQRFRNYPFTLGVASGDSLPDGTVLWTRLAPEPLDGAGIRAMSLPIGPEMRLYHRLRSGA